MLIVDFLYFIFFWWSVDVKILLINLIDLLFIYYVIFDVDLKLRGCFIFKIYIYDWYIDFVVFGFVRVIGVVFIVDSWNFMVN